MKGSAPGSCEQTRHVVVGTAGHIDHGKTALVYALTGTDTDRLPEEKKRGITIDLGFAALDLDNGDSGVVHLSLIDVPGHHAFIRNMLAGTGGIDCVILVIAADEGVKAQTEEHLAICTLLGIRHGVVVLTKADAVTPETLAETRAGVQHFLKGTFLESAPMVAVSALRGDGVADLKAALRRMATQIPARCDEFVPRVPIDRVFSMRGFGTVVTGTLHAGAIGAGQTLEQHPHGKQLRVRGMQVHGKDTDVARAPCRVALNLAGVQVADVTRGDTLSLPGTLAPVTNIDVELAMLDGAPRLKHGTRVRVHAFTTDTLARVLLFDPKSAVEPGSTQGQNLARLRLAKPLLLVAGDRIVLRQCSPEVTIGGGRVLDISAPEGTRKAATLAWLRSLQSAEEDEQLRLRIARRAGDGITISALVAETGLTADALHRRAARLLAEGAIADCDGSHGAAPCWISTEFLEQAGQTILEVLTEAGSLSKAELRSKAGLNAPVFGAAIERLNASSKLKISGELARLGGQEEEMPKPRRLQLQAIERIYAEAGLAAPLLSEVASRIGVVLPLMREFIVLLLRAKRLVRMGSDDAFVHSDALARLYADLQRHRGESFDVGRFKSFTGLTRKHAIPLLEHLDQARITRNNGGIRVVL
jgi:selenocysteine-specific elongation factor